MNDCKQYVSINNIKSSNKIINNGIPQGSIIGPLLFLIYNNNFPTSLLIISKLFADDTALLIPGKLIKIKYILANSELAKVSN